MGQIKGSFESTSGKRLEADRHDATTSSSDANDLNPQPACTTSTTTTGEDTTIKDILSVKNCFTKEILPPLARKLAKAATLTALVMNPVKDVFAATENKYDLVEIACSPTSTLTTAFEEAGLKCLRVNHLSGYNLDSKAGTSTLAQRLKEHPPRLAWVSLPYTRLSSLQNLTERDEEAWASFLKRRGQDSRRADEVAQALEPVIQEDDDFAWEWPIGAVTGWRSSAIKRLERLAKKYGRVIYWSRTHGCQYGLAWQGMPLRKGLQIMTTSRQLWLRVCRRCPGDPDRAECRGQSAVASSYYPPKLQKFWRRWDASGTSRTSRWSTSPRSTCPMSSRTCLWTWRRTSRRRRWWLWVGRDSTWMSTNWKTHRGHQADDDESPQGIGP